MGSLDREAHLNAFLLVGLGTWKGVVMDKGEKKKAHQVILAHDLISLCLVVFSP